MKTKFLYIKLVLFIIIGICLYFFLSFLFQNDEQLSIVKMSLTKYDEEKGTVDITVQKNSSFFIHNFNCIAYNDKISMESKGTNNLCTLTIPINDNYKIYVEINDNKSIDYNPEDYLSNLLSFHFTNTENPIYLLVGDTYSIPYTSAYITKKDADTFVSSDSSIASIDGLTVTGVADGEVTITSPATDETIDIVVTSLISHPYFSEVRKTIIPCHEYSEEQATLLDTLLKREVTDAGYQTRAGAVAAARFLTLEFKYRIPYFYENGRVHESGVNYADGEGRYYHEGLYLSESKKSSIVASFSGPAIWGCPLTNWEDEPYYGFNEGTKMPNGLDCSGFVAWMLKNAGFDPGDVGAGESSYPYQMTDLGDFVPINDASKAMARVGDLIQYDGHIAMIIGIDDTHYYVAESLPNLGGAVATVYDKTTVTKTFNNFVLMDKFYQKDGNLTNMWS